MPLSNKQTNSEGSFAEFIRNLAKMLAPPIRATKEGSLCPALMWFVHFPYVFPYVFTILEVRTTSATSHVRVICSNYFSSSAVR